MSTPLQIVGQSTLVAATATSRIDVPTADTLRIAVNELANNTGAWLRLGNQDVVAVIGTVSTAAAATLTSTGVFSAGEKAIIGDRTYTFVASLTVPAVPFEVLIGANQTASHLNLLRAINAGAGAGTLYGTGTPAHSTVTAASSDGTHTVLAAKTPGTGGNLIGTTEGAAAAAMANASWGGTVMASGADGDETSFFVPTRGELYIRRGGATHLAGIRAGSADAIVSITGLG